MGSKSLRVNSELLETFVTRCANHQSARPTVSSSWIINQFQASETMDILYFARKSVTKNVNKRS